MRRVVSKSFGSHRRLGQALWDALAWIVAVPLAVGVRYDFSFASGFNEQVIALSLFMALGQVAFGIAFQLYRGRYRIGSVDEIVGVCFTSGMLVILGTLGVVLSKPSGIPRSVPLLAGLISTLIMLAARLALRVHRNRIRTGELSRKALIYGAGETAENLLRLMGQEVSNDFAPVGLVDDDPTGQRRRINGLRVLGTGSSLAELIKTTGATVVIVAIATMDSKKLRAINEVCTSLNVELRVVPTANALINGQLRLNDISEVTVEDLLGRQPVDVDTSRIHKFLKDKCVLITGAGGSIGSELARQVAQFETRKLAFLDRDESSLLNLQLALRGNGLLGSDELILADIRDAARMLEVFQIVQPDIVFHAAALKHLSLLEDYPFEAIKTNIFGTANVLNAAVISGIETFVNISTDKAADPQSVLGQSKRITERLTCGVAKSDNERFLSVRFGNVLGSRGSVLHTFRRQIDSGGPLTVTHPEVTRYFMTIPEAVHLVLQAATFGSHGETFILDMGEPVSIASVAKQLIQKSGRDIEIAFSGLRPGEKLHEVLIGESENSSATLHPLITSVRPAALSLDALNEMDVHQFSLDELKRLSRDLDFSVKS